VYSWDDLDCRNSRPDEEIGERNLQIAKNANVFYPKATASTLTLAVPGAAAALSKATDGLWVGGRIEIQTTASDSAPVS
jgi:hypothetical protein